MVKLYIDDVRPSPSPEWVVVRSSAHAITFIRHFGVPDEISFDHDLGGDDTGMRVVDWLISETLDGNISIPATFSFHIHSANPVGAANLEHKLSNFLNFLFGDNSAARSDQQRKTSGGRTPPAL
jgi:hypothetical protein